MIPAHAPTSLHLAVRRSPIFEYLLDLLESLRQRRLHFASEPATRVPGVSSEDIQRLNVDLDWLKRRIVFYGYSGEARSTLRRAWYERKNEAGYWLRDFDEREINLYENQALTKEEFYYLDLLVADSFTLASHVDNTSHNGLETSLAEAARSGRHEWPRSIEPAQSANPDVLSISELATLENNFQRLGETWRHQERKAYTEFLDNDLRLLIRHEFALRHSLPPTYTASPAVVDLIVKKIATILRDRSDKAFSDNDLLSDVADSIILLEEEMLGATDESGRLHREILSNPAEQLKILFDEAVELLERQPALKTEAAGHPLALILQHASKSLVAGPSFEFAIVASKDVMSEEVRRKPAKNLWLRRDKSKKIDPVQFIRTNYRQRLGRGFTQADLKEADPSLYGALHQWLQKYDRITGKRNRLPKDMDLPTLEEWNERRLKQLEFEPNSIDSQERARLLLVSAGRALRASQKAR